MQLEHRQSSEKSRTQMEALCKYTASLKRKEYTFDCKIILGTAGKEKETEHKSEMLKMQKSLETAVVRQQERAKAHEAELLKIQMEVWFLILTCPEVGGAVEPTYVLFHDFFVVWSKDQHSSASKQQNAVSYFKSQL